MDLRSLGRFQSSLQAPCFLTKQASPRRNHQCKNLPWNLQLRGTRRTQYRVIKALYQSPREADEDANGPVTKKAGPLSTETTRSRCSEAGKLPPELPCKLPGIAVWEDDDRRGFQQTTQDWRVKARSRPQWLSQLLRALACVLLGLTFAGFSILTGKSGGRLLLRPPVATAATCEIPIQPQQLKSHPPKIKVQERVGYALDYFFSTEPLSKAVILAAITVSLTVGGGFMYQRATAREEPAEKPTLGNAMWNAWTFVADPGTHAGESTLWRRTVALFLTLSGMLFFALLIGLMSDAVSSKVDELQKGATVVIEQDHTLVIGWTPKTIPLVKMLSSANADRSAKRPVVVLGNLEKQVMDAELLEDLPVVDRQGTRVVTRKGVPTMMEDLRRCSITSAGTIVVLSPEGYDPDEADAQVLQTCLLLSYLPDMRADIVAEFAELDNVQVLQRMHSTLVNREQPLIASEAASPDKAPPPSFTPPQVTAVRKMVPVQAGDIAFRMMVLKALEPELSEPIDELLCFEGNEFRFKYWPELVGHRFGDVSFMFKEAVPCGIRTAKPNAQGHSTRINPPPETVIQEGDSLMVLSLDSNSYKPGPCQLPTKEVVQVARQKNLPVLKVLLCGWKNDFYDILSFLDIAVAPGSEVHLLGEVSWAKRTREIDTGPPLRNIRLVHYFGNPTVRSQLAKLPLESFDKVIVLAKEGLTHEQRKADSSTTTTAMFVRHIQVERGKQDCTIVAELPQSNFNALAQVQKIWLSDHIVPDQVQAMVLANLAEDVKVGEVLDEIVSNYGSNIQLESLMSYALDGEQLSFWELQARSLDQGDLIIGYKCKSTGDKWTLNPGNKNTPLTWSDTDQVAILTRGL